jgi:hypothetical protein
LSNGGSRGQYYSTKRASQPTGVPNQSLGNALSYPNSTGNLFNGFTKQDDVCSLPGLLGSVADACVLGRCQKHDSCYAQSECNASFWVTSILGGTKLCNQCNSNFFK